jgi:hypothetical protein
MSAGSRQQTHLKNILSQLDEVKDHFTTSDLDALLNLSPIWAISSAN